MGNDMRGYNFIQQTSGLTAKIFAESLRRKVIRYHILRGLSKPSKVVLERFSQTYYVNLHWFLAGKGPSGIDPDTIKVELLKQEAVARAWVDVQNYAERWYLQILRSLIAPYKPDRLMALHVAGNSMIEERINDGNIVIFHFGNQAGCDGVP